MKLTAAIGCVGLLLCGCRLKSGEQPAQEDRPTEAEPEEVVLTHLPDTCLESVSALEYKITLLDSIHPGRIDDLKDLYAEAPGIMTFRGGPERALRAVELERQPDSLYVEWEFTTAADWRKTNLGSWGGGTGWTGQPLYVEWPDSHQMEIIFASLCGRVYSIDFETGDETRESIRINHPVKGTPTLDPTLNGLLYGGHGVRFGGLPWGQFVVDLRARVMTCNFGQDSKAWRPWNGNDSSPVRVGQFVFHPSENGTLYKRYVGDGEPVLHSTMQYRVKGAGAAGMEASMAAWRNYGYLADNHGNIVCVNLDTMQPVWRYNNQDDTDSTPVISHEGDRTYLYSGCEVDRKAGGNTCRLVKLDALTGELVWENCATSRKVTAGGHHYDGGYFSTPLLGTGVCEDLIFVNRVLNTRSLNGEFVAIEKETGKDRYRVPFGHYAWSSPVGFTSRDGKFTVVTGDGIGNMYMIDGETGRVLYKQHVGANFESSPIAVGNSVVLGSRGNKIFKLRLETCKR